MPRFMLFVAAGVVATLAVFAVGVAKPVDTSTPVDGIQLGMTDREMFQVLGMPYEKDGQVTKVEVRRPVPLDAQVVIPIPRCDAGRALGLCAP